MFQGSKFAKQCEINTDPGKIFHSGNRIFNYLYMCANVFTFKIKKNSYTIIHKYYLYVHKWLLMYVLIYKYFRNYYLANNHAINFEDFPIISIYFHDCFSVQIKTSTFIIISIFILLYSLNIEQFLIHHVCLTSLGTCIKNCYIYIVKY